MEPWPENRRKRHLSSRRRELQCKLSHAELMAQETTELSIEQLQAALAEALTKVQALERAKTGLMDDLQKRKGIERMAKAAGIDLSSEDAEDKIADLLATKTGSGESKGTAASGQSAGTQEQSASPASAVEEAMKAQLASMQRQMTELGNKLAQAEKEKDAERRARLEGHKESVVMQELEKAGCKRPKHVYALLKKSFRLLNDDETVVYGPEENPINVADAVSNLEKDEEYSIYFPGVQASGAGLPTSRSSMPTTDNPFTKSASNVTKASEIIARDPAYAKRLAQQARARGDADPILCRHAMG